MKKDFHPDYHEEAKVRLSTSSGWRRAAPPVLDRFGACMYMFPMCMCVASSGRDQLQTQPTDARVTATDISEDSCFVLELQSLAVARQAVWDCALDVMLLPAVSRILVQLTEKESAHKQLSDYAEHASGPFAYFWLLEQAIFERHKAANRSLLVHASMGASQPNWSYSANQFCRFCCLGY